MRQKTARGYGINLCFAVLATFALASLLLASHSSAAGPNAVRNLAGCTTNSLAANDDGSTGLVPIGFTADFFGADSFNQLYVNNNGNVTVNGPLGDYTPFDFTTTGEVMIAPFLADIDTRGVGSVTYGTGANDGNGHAYFCVNWADVGYYANHIDKTNSLQLLLINRSDTGAGNFDIELNYDRISWETGDASDGENGLGGTSAAVGFANGDGDPSHFFVADGSFANGALLDGGPKALIAGMMNSGGQLGRYVFPVRNSAPTGATLTGEVQRPDSDGGDPIASAPVEICPTGGGACISRFTNSSGVFRAVNLPAGSYNLTAHSAAGDTEYADGLAGPVAVSGTSEFTQDVQLGEPLGGPPPGTTIGSIGESPDGIPTLYWSDPSPLETEAATGCTATYTVTIGGEVVQSGSMVESPPGSGIYTATIPPLSPNHGNGVVNIDMTGAGCDDIEFAIYIDPSGVVRNAATNALIGGAAVILSRSADADGPFVQVPDGSAIMSPGNRNNPDETDSNGHFGWDVIAGYYKVTATAPGCSSVTTAAMNIPPPVTNLNIQLNCPTGGGEGGGGGGNQTLTAPPKKKKKKCKKAKPRSAQTAKKCAKKRSVARNAPGVFAAGMPLFVGSPEGK